jgi:hypothetical protein
MGRLCLVEQNAILELARVAHHDAITGDDVLAHVATAANLAVFADPRWALQHRALLNDRSSADEHAIADERFAHKLSEHGGFQSKLQITRDLFERIPDVILVLEQLRMSSVFEVQKIGRGKHFQYARSGRSQFPERHVFAVWLLEPFRQLNSRVHDTFVAVLRDHAAPGAFAKHCVIFLGHE